MHAIITSMHLRNIKVQLLLILPILKRVISWNNHIIKEMHVITPLTTKSISFFMTTKIYNLQKRNDK